MMKPVLLVEDNDSDEMLVTLAMKEGGLANPLVVARDGQEALDYLFGQGDHAGRDPADLPAVVLLDLRLPKVDGMEVLQRLRADPRTKLLPVVILTSSDEDKDRLGCYEHGANSFVRKPVAFDEFQKAVRALKLYWLLVNQPPP